METVTEAAMGMGRPQETFEAAPSAPAPPPPAPMGMAPGAPPPPPLASQPSASGGLLAGLQTVQLKSVENLPDLKEMNDDQAQTLAATLQKAMLARRENLIQSDDEFESDEAWSE